MLMAQFIMLLLQDSEMYIKYLCLFLIALSLSSCVNREESERCYKHLSGVEVGIPEDASFFRLVYASDSLIIAHSFSNKNKLTAYCLSDDGCTEENFLMVGKGPLEVLDAFAKYKSDSLYVMSFTPMGVSAFITIPLKNYCDVSAWKVQEAEQRMLAGADFAPTGNGEYVIVGGEYDTETVLTKYNSSDGLYSNVTFWPDDGFEGGNIVKQLIYVRSSYVSVVDQKILYVAGEGKLATIIDVGKQPVDIREIYSDYPQYAPSEDGMNPRRNPKSGLGAYSFATEEYIYLSPLLCHLNGINYEPSDYKGYPPYFTDEIDVFDWDGCYKCTYVLDQPLCNYYVNEEEQVIYALSCDKNTLTSAVRKYELPKME